MRHKSPLCSYMLERARRVGVSARIASIAGFWRRVRKHIRRVPGKRCAITWSAVMKASGATESEAIEVLGPSGKEAHESLRRLAV